MANARRDLGLDAIRIYLGLGLLARGVMMGTESGSVIELVAASGQDEMLSVLVLHYVVPAHVFCGGMLMVGAMTRLMAALQVPILVGAVYFVHFQEGLLAAGQGLEFSALTLFLLLTIVVFGPGRLSVDARYFPGEAQIMERDQADMLVGDNVVQIRREAA